MMITFSELRRILSYDPETGHFTWLVRPAMRIPARSIAGSVNKRGYRMIQVKGKLYSAARLAWFYMKGEWPVEQIDHKYGANDDNRIDELRLATNAENCRNRGVRRDNTSGYKGVYWNKGEGKWVARVNIDGKRVLVGYFDELSKAAAARHEAAAAAYGEFYRPF